MAQYPPSPLVWCDDCCKLISTHPLIHQIDEHAPRIGSRVGPSQSSWITAVLQERS